MGSQLVAVRTGLMAALAEATGFENVECSYAYKKGRKDPRESAWTADAQFILSPAGMRAGKKSYDEIGTFVVRILVRGIGLAQEETDDRAAALGLVVFDFVANNASGGAAINADIQTLTVNGTGDLTPAYNDHGTLAQLDLPIRFTARLT